MSKAIPPSILGLVLLALSCPVAWGGGSKEDYERADTLVRRYEGRVLNEELELTWVDAERAVYRRQMSSDAWQWMLVDAEAGTRAEAFDHAAVARKFAKILGSPADRGRIRLTPLEVKDGRLLVLSGARALAIDLATSAVEVLDLKDVDLLRLPPVKADRSKNGGKETAILFVNATEGPVKVVWLDLEGKPHEYATVAAGASQRQHTYAGHVWRVEGADGTSLSTFRARGEIGVAFVRGEAPDPAAAKPKTTPRKPRGTSPDGRWRVFVREHDVYLEDLSGGGTRRLTSDGKAEDGYASRVSWSPSSRTVMVWRSEPGVDHRVYAVDSVPDDRFEPRLRSWNYLKPGDRLPVRRPHLFDVERGERIDLPDDLFPTPYAISHVSWAPEGERFRFLYNERGHQVLRFLELDAEAEKVRTLIEETSETFVDYSQKTILDPLKPGDRWAWMSERSGTNHLYLLDAEMGELTPITQGPWLVRRVLARHVDGGADAGSLLFEAMGVYPDQDPYHVHVGRVREDGSDLVWLTEGDGTHEVVFSPGGDHYVDTFSRVDLPPVHELRRTKDGSLVMKLEEADGAALLAAGWRPPVRVTAKGRDGKTDIWGVLFLPSTFDASTSYPVVEEIYAGPHGHHVPKRFSVWHGARNTAELGFVVAKIDGMGTNWRSKAFHDVCWKNLADAGLPDRVLWLRATAAERPWMDLSRVGIYGGSAGGQSAMRALLAHSDTYHVAVADCGCHDNRMDKIWWNEAWMGWPIGPHYEAQSNVTQAKHLEGKLLLMVGEVDRNVDPASTMKVVDALIRADKDFEMLVIPGQGHGAAGTPYGTRRLRDFLVRHLLGVEPRWE